MNFKNFCFDLGRVAVGLSCILSLGAGQWSIAHAQGVTSSLGNSPLAAAEAASDNDTKSEKPQIVVDDIFVQPQLKISEPGQGGVDPLLWSFGVKSKFSSWVDAQVSVGAKQLLYLPSWAPANPNSFSVLEAHATLHTLYGDLSAGQIVVPWGLDGLTVEKNLWLPRTLVFETGQFPLIDTGALFHTESGSFFMNVAGHNGEGAGTSNLDNRMLLTAQWGYQGPANSIFGLSATAGRLGPPNLTQDFKVRGGDAFFGFNIFGLGLQLEGSYLEKTNDLTTTDLLDWHADLEHPLTDHLNLVARYEQLTPNTKISGVSQGRTVAGLEYHSTDNSSRLFLFGIKNTESPVDTPNDEIRLAWRISPPLE